MYLGGFDAGLALNWAEVFSVIVGLRSWVHLSINGKCDTTTL